MKIRWNGSSPTLVRLSPTGQKNEILPGDEFEVSDVRGGELLRYSADFKVVKGVVDDSRIEKAHIDLKAKIMACETLEDFEAMKTEVAQGASPAEEAIKEKKSKAPKKDGK